MNPIVSLDPTTPLDPKPLISDILRTRYCVPGSVFLVESIQRSIPVAADGLSSGLGSGSGTGLRGGRRQSRRRRGRERAVRLLLGDGELCVQAFVRGEIHCFVDGGGVYEGCYVRLDRFWLGEVEVAGMGEVADDGVGDSEYLGMLRMEREEAERERRLQLERGEEGLGQAEGELVVAHEVREDVGKEAEEYEDDELIDQLMAVEGNGETTGAATRETTTTNFGPPGVDPPESTQRDPNELDYTSDSDSAFETLAVSAERASQRRILTSAPDPRQELQASIIKQNQNDHRRQNHQHAQPQPQAQPQQQPPQPQPLITKPRPWLPTSATQFVKLTPLSQIPSLPYRQNWMVNVLAILTSLSPVQPSHIGPSFVQRTARLTDMSTPKQVLLTVYLDPEGFTPREGGVVLLLGVKNHFGEGGSLRKYVSDGLGVGESWWVAAEEGGLGWCRAGVERLGSWWREKGREGRG
ncbi:hypothetical protein CHGG_08053 [Chaetomium globosum CBS 148.51]|uniref:Uncharacterized protein n=1 Tax=Chaetomium globosum (strain ATCC 6205 / CBS 148.51 / DSM 1962 / NBRC 6347 / NRRL 1970) TaxID=306901 RepID=Q2GVF1_CHAGB|nr:uncharacterized protein CHGG_08053 [Chaetomium globosum CBS 148.51]EAQ86800.1 hypothetical protein CHGG_08053 [Chaetomium globosum CBS 148.51]